MQRKLRLVAWAEKLGIPVHATAPLPHQLPYRADIDGLRAVAVLSVVIFHAFPAALGGGFVGVDVFFVISGFLISSLIFKEIGDGNLSVASFYGRRIRRLLPSLLLVLVAVLAVGWVVLLPGEFVSLAKMAIGGSLYVPNFVIWKETNYFAPAAENAPLLHLWSLGIEEQFYFVYPFFVLLFWRRRFGLVLVAAGVLSFAANIALIRDHPTEAFYLPISRFWELVAGASLAWHARTHPDRPEHQGMASDWLRNASAALGLAVMLAAMMMFRADMAFPGWPALMPVLATVLVIAAGPAAILNRYFLANPLVVFIGLLSYPLYLWHWPILSVLHIVWGEVVPVGPLLLAVFAAFLLAWLTYMFVERPIRSLRLPQAKSLASRALLAGVALSAFAGVVVWQWSGFPERFPSDVVRFATYQPDIRSWRQGTCFLRPEQGPQDWRPNCIDAPTARAQPVVLVWGDSHGADLRAGLLALQAHRQFRLAQMTASACAPLVGVEMPTRPRCREINDAFARQVLKIKPDIVILAGDWYSEDFHLLVRTIPWLKRAGVRRIVVLGPPLHWRLSLPNLLVRYAIARHTAIPHMLPLTFTKPAEETAFAAFARTRGVLFASPRSVFCHAGECLAMTGQDPADVAFIDNSHLNDAGSVYLIGKLADQLLGPPAPRP